MHADAAEVQVLLEGVALPSEKQKLVDYARSQDADARAVALLQGLPERKYSSIDEVGEALAPVQPRSAHEDAELPRAESGKPPGGDDYTRPSPDSGAVRPSAPRSHPPEKALQKQTQTQAEQQQRQKDMLGEEKKS